MEPAKVVVRFTDGKILKGVTSDFLPNKPIFHVSTGHDNKGTEVKVRDLKAIFWVKDFGGNPVYNERKEFEQGQQQGGRKAEVTFTDGEVLVGTTLGYDPNRQGFFITTPDPKSNNNRFFVVSAAVKSVRFL